MELWATGLDDRRTEVTQAHIQWRRICAGIWHLLMKHVVKRTACEDFWNSLSAEAIVKRCYIITQQKSIVLQTEVSQQPKTHYERICQNKSLQRGFYI
jgi:hypothetical protein